MRERLLRLQTESVTWANVHELRKQERGKGQVQDVESFLLHRNTGNGATYIKHVPKYWQVHTDHGDFEITDWKCFIKSTLELRTSNLSL